jgi:dipeptidyl-peptidase-4
MIFHWLSILTGGRIPPLLDEECRKKIDPARVNPLRNAMNRNSRTNHPFILRRFSLMCAAAIAMTAAVHAKDEAAPAKKIGWIKPVEKQIEGWTVQIDPALLFGEHQEEGGRALKMLANHLQRIAILMPEKSLAKMRKLGIRIEHDHPELKNMQYHPDVDWLVEHGYDPQLVKKVHIPVAAELLSREQMLKHPAVILHELAHAYHDQVLDFDDPGIIKAYDEAMKKGLYDRALLYTGKHVKHYATTDHKEYFAEATEAYFYKNDFYPFVRAELAIHDPVGYAEVKRVWESAE